MEEKPMRKPIYIIYIMLVFFTLVYCTGTGNTDTTTSGIMGEAMASITEAELEDMLTYLASDELKGRLSGEEGCEISAEFIESEFEQYGLLPYKDNSYQQPFSFIEKVISGEETSFSYTHEEQSEELVQNEDYAVTSFTAEASYQGEVAFVGYSVITDEYNDYQDIDIDGKAVIMMPLSHKGPHYYEEDAHFGTKFDNAIEQGAKAIIFVNAPEYVNKDFLYPLFYHPSIKTREIPVMQLSWKGFKKLTSHMDKDLRSIQKRINKDKKPESFIIEGVTVSITADLVMMEDETANVIGYLPGNDPEMKDEVVVIGAHYDHIGMGEVGSRSNKSAVHNGADDNASGTVAVMELAEAFAQVKDELDRTFVFIAFSGEEYGLFGSKHYVDNPLFPIEDTVFMLNFDMVGRLKDTLYARNTNSDDIFSIMNTIGKDYPFEMEFPEDGSGGSDHLYFAMSDVPVSFLHTGLHDQYHTPADDVEMINFQGLEQITRYGFELLWEVDNMDERPLVIQDSE
jgi:hypothetical protein